MTISKDDKIKIEKLADKLAEAFDWSDTPQGEEYWLEVSENLYVLAQEDET